MSAEGGAAVRVPACQAGAIHTPCYFTPGGANEIRCSGVSSVLGHNKTGCCPTACASPWRKCKECVRYGLGLKANVVKPGSAYCTAHQDVQKREDELKAKRDIAEEKAKKKRLEPGRRSIHPSLLVPKKVPKQVVAKPTSLVPKSAPVSPIPNAEASLVELGHETKALSVPVVRHTVESVAEGRHLIAEIKRAVGNAVYEVVDVERVRAMEGQPRKYFDPTKLQLLADSIRECGQFMPGFLRRIPSDQEGHDYEMVDGERRLRAIRAAGVETYKALVIEVSDRAAQFLVSIIANFHREGHTVLETADAIRAAHEDLHLPLKEVAESVGFSENYTAQLYGLRRLIPELRGLLDPGDSSYEPKKFSAAAALAISGRPPEVQKALAEGFMRGEISLQELRREGRLLTKAQGGRVYGEDRPGRVIDAKISLLRKQTIQLVDYLIGTSDEALRRMKAENVREYLRKLEMLHQQVARVEDRFKHVASSLR